MDLSEARKLMTREEENGLKRLLAGAMLVNVALKDLLGKRVTPAAHREAAAHQSTHGMSEWRACRLLGVDRFSMRYPGDAIARCRSAREAEGIGC